MCCFFERARGSSLEPHYPDNFNRETVCPHERDDSFSFDHRSSIFFAILYTRAGPLQTSTSSLTKRASNGRKNRDCLVISSGLLAYEFVVTRVTRRIEVGIRYTRSLNFRLGTIMKRGFTFGGWCSLRSECWGRILLNADTYGVGGIKR